MLPSTGCGARRSLIPVSVVMWLWLGLGLEVVRCTEVVTMLVEDGVRLSGGGSTFLKSVSKRNGTECGEACRAEAQCAGSTLGQVSPTWSSVNCQLYAPGFTRVRGYQPGWTTFTKLINGAPMDTGIEVRYKQTYIFRNAGVVHVVESESGGLLEAHGVARAIVGIIIVSVLFFGICCAITRPRRGRGLKLTTYNPQDQVTAAGAGTVPVPTVSTYNYMGPRASCGQIGDEQ